MSHTTQWHRMNEHRHGVFNWWRYRDAAERPEGGPALEYQTDEERAIDALKEQFDNEARNSQPTK
jgi:hypothetical protein